MNQNTQQDQAGANRNALVVRPVLRGGHAHRDESGRLAEAVKLTESVGLLVAHAETIAVRAPTAATLFGEGQATELGRLIAASDLTLAVVDAALSPIQQRNLEQRWNCKVIDRTGLILEIFGERAHTREGGLQVELAHLQYQRSRLVRSWTHLGRQRGGFGFLGGPGETQIESDRRIMRDRIARLREEIEDVRQTRSLQRRARQRANLPVVALVGYTNAGKSTLFNKLTGAHVFASDQLFATLDPTARGFELASGRRVVLTDTVGFISDLPTKLIAAFRATLEEVAAADVILHVQDATQPDAAAQRQDVISVLNGMVESGMLDEPWPARTIDVLNKTDLLGGPGSVGAAGGAIAISAATGEGVDRLLAAIEVRLSEGEQTVGYDLPATEGTDLAWLYQHGTVIGRQEQDGAVHVTVRLSAPDRARFERRRSDAGSGVPPAGS
jgi:GTP-binding protein HflX